MSTSSRSRAQAKHESRAPKLRNSCDACAAAKVRCSKDHPRCDRCACNSLRCIYGVSLKHGKPQRRKLPTESRSSPPQRLQPTSAGCDHLQGYPTYGESPSHDFCSDLQSSLDNVIHDLGNSNTVESGGWVASDSDFPITRDTSRQPLTSLSEFFPPFEKAISDSTSMSSVATPSDSSLYSGQDTPLSTPSHSFTELPKLWIESAVPVSSTRTCGYPEFGDQQNQSSHSTLQYSCCARGLYTGFTDCQTEANTVLNLLSSGPSALLLQNDSSYQPAPDDASSNYSFDSIMSLVQRAINTIAPLPSCSCVRASQTARLFGTIIKKIIYWHRVAATSLNHFTAQAPNTPASAMRNLNMGARPKPTTWPMDSAAYNGLSDTTINPPPGEVVRIGTYIPDAEDQDPIRRLLILNSLKKVARLIAELEREMDHTGTAVVLSLKCGLAKTVRLIEKG